MTTSRTAGIQLEEILDLGEYERRRDTIRQSAMKARSLRRVALGPNATLSFENRETIRYQIHEMCRAERLAKPEKVAHEIETYNEILTTSSELAATLLIEFPDKEERTIRLRELLGLEKHLHLEVGGTLVPAVFDKRQIDVDRLSSVQFVRFPLTPDQLAAILRRESVKVVCDHPRYDHLTVLSDEVARALSSDLEEAAGYAN